MASSGILQLSLPHLQDTSQLVAKVQPAWVRMSGTWHHKRRPLKRIRQGHQLLQEVFLLCERVEIQGHQVLHLPEHIS